jgi:Family of unknown function (DUF6516)
MLDELTTHSRVVNVSNMKARQLLNERVPQGDESFAELRVYLAPSPVAGSSHSLKYSLAFVVRGVCVLRYDNEAGKGDHKHVGGSETPYGFTTPATLIADFWRDVDEWKARK